MSKRCAAVLCAMVGALGAQVATPVPAGRAALQAAAAAMPAAVQPLAAFLVQHMPDTDAAALTPAFVQQQCEQALAARARVAWGKALSDDLFVQFVLPYAQANERREDWRTDFAERFLPLVQGCKTPGEAAQKLNATIFGQLKVHYSTARRAADQAPSESIAQGKATCTGLSILLADACRACCVPARLVSVRWPDKSGNHTWVEVWDGERWRCCGADEPDPAGLDRGWFVGKAADAAANADAAFHPFAVSFAATGQRFAAGWGPGIELHGIDVAAHYGKPAQQSGSTAQQQGSNAQQPQGDAQAAADAAVLVQLARFFAASADEQAKFEFDQNLDRELGTAAGDARLRALAWRAFVQQAHKELRADFAADRVRAGDKESPYVLKQVGTRPAGGWPLVIAMHGGGGVPKAINDQQWQHMQIYYKDHPEAGGYLYCALRAPTDEWNGFYTDYVYPLIERLILQFAVCAEVDVDKVYAIGYSHGGYGAFAIGPKLPHRFAAVHASASAPSDGQTVATGLHSLKFSFMVGGKDTAYGRRDRCEAFAKILQGLQQAHPGLYPTTFTLVEGNGHTGLPDRDILPKLLAERRAVLGKQLFWELTDGVVRDHYWLHVDAPAGGQRIDAELDGNTLRVRNATAPHAEAWLDARLVDAKAPLVIVDGELRRDVTPSPSLRVLCRTLQQRGDPQLAASFVVTLR